MAAPPSAFEIVLVCYKVGKQVVALVNTWKAADDEVRQRVVIVESTWDRSKRQVDFMQKIAPVIDDELFSNLDDLLHELLQCLSAAASKLESMEKKVLSRKPSLVRLTSRGKSEYILKKKALDALIFDLETWQKRFDISWFLIMKIASPVIDKELSEANAVTERSQGGPPNVARDPLAAATSLRSVLTPTGGQQKSMALAECPMETAAIAHSEVRLGRLTGDSKWYLIDSVSTRNAADVSALKRNVRQLAVKLSQADPIAYGLLSCKGVMPVTSHDAESGWRDVSAFYMVFRIPQGMDVLHSLRHLLLSPSRGMSVTHRVRLACELATSVSYVHTFGFVHKNIRPESILCFENVPQKRSHTFLTGFESFRAADGATNYHGDLEWERNLYRHPLRQGAYPADKYRMEHDIYSLGVCLLEVGLWESFVEYNFQGTGHVARPVPGPWYGRFQNWLSAFPQALAHQMPWKVKDYLIEMADDLLPARMGDKYTNVVLGCLSCLDLEETADVSKRSDAHVAGMAVAVQFVEQTVVALREILT